ncbi:MAG: transcriptional regulator, TetR family, partial [Acidobacteria bacterium]|nr:transcriptional regulator, TetR family [Acidobacteriota bacterium]
MGRRPTVNRDELLATARRIFGQKGFERATLADIAGELGVTPAALLRHVDSKQALFAESMRGGRIELPEALLALATVDASADPRVILRRFALEFIPFVQQMISVQMAVHMHRSAQTSLVVP